MSGLARSGAVLGFSRSAWAWRWSGWACPGTGGRGWPGGCCPTCATRPGPPGSSTTVARSGGALAVVAAPVLRDLGSVVERVMGGTESVRRRQQRAGLAADVDRFRAEQVLWGALGAVVGGALGVLALVLRDSGVVTVVMSTAIGSGLGVTGGRLPAVPSRRPA